MTASIRLPTMLAETMAVDTIHQVDGSTVDEVLGDLFRQVPGLRHHILDEFGAIRPHVSVFVDGDQARLGTRVRPGSDVRVLHAVSGGALG